jgi:HAD superfamily hydrolase (TIGR01509 family)
MGSYHRRYRCCDGVHQRVEYLMKYLRPLMTKWRDGLWQEFSEGELRPQLGATVGKLWAEEAAKVLKGFRWAEVRAAQTGSRCFSQMYKRAILFDIDGTLVDSNDAHVEAWRRAFANEGYVFGRSQIHAQIGKGGDNLVPTLLPGAAADLEVRLTAAEAEIFKRDFRKQVEPFEGAAEALKKLAALGHTLVLASSASDADVQYYVDLLDADGLLSGTTSKDDVASSKPCPDIFTAALKLSGSAPESAVVVGDSPYDIIAARRAGIDAIAVLSGGFEVGELATCEPLAICPSVSALAADHNMLTWSLQRFLLLLSEA